MSQRLNFRVAPGYNELPTNIPIRTIPNHGKIGKKSTAQTLSGVSPNQINHLWMAASKIYKIDRSDGSILDSFNIPGEKPGGIEYYDNSIWICDHYLSKIFRMSPSDGSIISTYDVESEYPWGIAFDDTSTAWVSSQASPFLLRTNIVLYDDLSPPHILPSNDVDVALDSTGNIISWTLYDDSPDIYTIYKNNVEIDTDSWEDGDLIQVNVDNLPTGTYDYSITALDTYGNSDSSTIKVTVSGDLTVVTFSNPLFFLFCISLISITYSQIRKKKEGYKR